MTRRAFTLIEMLVVVAIISLLVGITMPSLREARRVSKKTVCKENLRQIGMAIHEYLVPHRDTFFWACRLPSYEPQAAQQEQRKPYPPLPKALGAELGGASEVFACPADANTKSPDIPTPRYFDSEQTSYEWESQLNGKRIDFRGVRLVDGDFLFRAQDMWMAFDFEAFHGGDKARGSHNVLYADLRVQSDNWNMLKQIGRALSK